MFCCRRSLPDCYRFASIVRRVTESIVTDVSTDLIATCNRVAITTTVATNIHTSLFHIALDLTGPNRVDISAVVFHLKCTMRNAQFVPVTKSLLLPRGLASFTLDFR